MWEKQMTTTLFFGGVILTCDAGGSVVEALAIRNGRVVATGDLASVKAAAGRRAREINLAGATLLPGLIDTHPHMMHFGVFDSMCADLSDAVDHKDIVARLQERAKTTSRGDWVLGSPIGEPHYFIEHNWRNLKEGILPDRYMLDQVSDQHPVMIMAWAPTTPNHLSMNSVALERLGLDSNTPDKVSKVWIEKDEAGEPTGRLSGSVNNYYSNDPFWDSLIGQIPLPGAKSAIAATKKSMKEYHAMGVTTVYEGHAMTLEQIMGYKVLRWTGQLTMRVLCCPDAEGYGTPWADNFTDREFDDQLKKVASMVTRKSDMLRIDGVTVGRGGPCGPGHTLMRQPYKGPYGELTTGTSFMSRERAERAIDFCSQNNLRLNIITAGTQENEDYLEHLEELGLETLQSDGRTWILQHLYFVEEQQAKRFGALGFDATTSMSFSWGKGDLVRERMGEELLKDFIPIKRLMNSGMRVACGSDWGPKNIFKHIALAVEPTFAGSGDKYEGEAQAISREESLATWTSEAAHVLRWDDIGSLEVGSNADIAIVDRSPLTTPLEEMSDTVVHATLVGGNCVHGEEYLIAKGWKSGKKVLGIPVPGFQN